MFFFFLNIYTLFPTQEHLEYFPLFFLTVRVLPFLADGASLLDGLCPPSNNHHLVFGM